MVEAIEGSVAEERQTTAPQKKRELYDRFRSHYLFSGMPDFKTVLTAGVAAAVTEGEVNLIAVLNAVKDFDDFNGANDPYEEHDFAKITVADRAYFWKIDDFGPAWQDHAPARYVLTLMFPEEY